MARGVSYNTLGRSGFSVEFGDVKGMQAFAAGIEDGAIVIANVSIQTVVLTIDTLKQKLRTYFDSVFTGSTPTRNSHRRATNAMVQSAIFNDMEAKGQFAGLIYSKLGRGMGPQSFIDYLLAHPEGSTLQPQGGWLRIAEDERYDGSDNDSAQFVPYVRVPDNWRIGDACVDANDRTREGTVVDLGEEDGVALAMVMWDDEMFCRLVKQGNLRRP